MPQSLQDICVLAPRLSCIWTNFRALLLAGRKTGGSVGGGDDGGVGGFSRSDCECNGEELSVVVRSSISTRLRLVILSVDIAFRLRPYVMSALRS